jgi:tRNA-specific adenosine deaminase 3
LPGDGGVDLQHLRRFAKTRDVPKVVWEAFEKARAEAVGNRGETGSTVFDLGSLSYSNALQGRDLAAGSGRVRETKVASSESNSIRESLTAASKDSVSRTASTLAQGKRSINSDTPEPESAGPSTQTELKTDPDVSTRSKLTISDSNTADEVGKELFLIVGSTNIISSATVTEELSSIVYDAVIFSIQVPRLAPTSQGQATLWSSQYWPTVYKKSNPFGPHPSIVSRAQQEIQSDVQKWMDIASEVARQGKLTGSGEEVGVVVVERKNGIGHCVAVAGDARWMAWPSKGAGNVTAHAAMRAIAMVADQLKMVDESEESASTVSTLAVQPLVKTVSTDQSNCTDLAWTVERETEKIAAEKVVQTGAESSTLDSRAVIWNTKRDTDVIFMYAEPEKQVDAANIFQDKPVLAAEKDGPDLSGMVAGYLCHELEIYCTHEPCVMCSMAILHSRFGKVIFQNGMPRTGGMCAEGDLGHGLFWRKELNWTLLAWQWVPRDSPKLEFADFHA